MIPPLVKGPQTPYNNPPIEPQFFQPSVFVISLITIGNTTLVTTVLNNNYVIGQLVRLIIPNGYGCTELNEITGYVIQIPLQNEIIININSSTASSFIPASLPNKPHVVAVGEINSGSINASGNMQTGTFIPGSFINISPL